MKVTSSRTYVVLQQNFAGLGSEHDTRGAPKGGTGGQPPPWDLKNIIFSGFLPLNYVICIFEVCFLKIFAMWQD